MAEESFPFQELAEGDRTVSAAMFAKHLGGIRARGVNFGVDNQLQVTESSPQAMSVDTGAAFVGLTEQRAYRNTLSRTVPIAAADPTDPRHDLVVLEMDTASGVRTVTAKIVQGTPAASPLDPALTQTEVHYQLAIARVVVPAAAVNIKNADIADLRTFSTPRNFPQAVEVNTFRHQIIRTGTIANGDLSACSFEFDQNNGPVADSARLWYGSIETTGWQIGRYKRDLVTDEWYWPGTAADTDTQTSETNWVQGQGCFQHMIISATEYVFIFAIRNATPPYNIVGRRLDADTLSNTPVTLGMTGFNTHQSEKLYSFFDGTFLWIYAAGTTRTVYKCSFTATSVTVVTSFTPSEGLTLFFTDGSNKVWGFEPGSPGSVSQPREVHEYDFAGVLQQTQPWSPGIGVDAGASTQGQIGRLGNRYCIASGLSGSARISPIGTDVNDIFGNLVS